MNRPRMLPTTLHAAGCAMRLRDSFTRALLYPLLVTVTSDYIFSRFITSGIKTLFNMAMVYPNDVYGLYVNYARRYQALLCVPIYASSFLSVGYLLDRRATVARRDIPVPIASIQLIVIALMTIFAASGFVVYLVPYVFVFWDCDQAIQTAQHADKWTDILFYVGTGLFLLVIFFYSLQRARLESDKEIGFAHEYEHLIKSFNSAVIVALFIKIVVDKVFVVYRDMVCPNLIDPSMAMAHLSLPVKNQSVQHHRAIRSSVDHGPSPSFSHESSALDLSICHEMRQFSCDVHALDPVTVFLITLDKKMFRPFIYVVAAELFPLMYCLHRNCTSHHYWKTRAESPIARFSFPEIRQWLVDWVYRCITVVLIPIEVFLLGYTMVLVGSNAGGTPLRGFMEIDVARTIYNLVRFALFVGIYMSVFHNSPSRYTTDSPWYKKQLRNSYKTALVEHAGFDSAVIMFTLGMKVVMAVSDLVIIGFANSYSFHDAAEISQLMSMISEWLVLRQMLILNDSELLQWPLHSKSMVGLGSLLAVAGTFYGYESFIEEFVKHIYDKLTLAHAHGSVDSMILASFLVTESLYFGVSLFYFTLGTCWLEIVHRYIHLGAFSLGEIRVKEETRKRGMTTTWEPVTLRNINEI